MPSGSAKTLPPDHSVAIIGAGPVGTYTALTAANHGVDVAVYEEHSIVGEPAHCTGHLNLGGLQRLHITPPPRTVQSGVRLYKFFSPAGHELVFDSSSPRSVIVDRRLFDRWLSAEAEKRGVSLRRGHRVLSVRLDSSRRSRELAYTDGKKVQDTTASVVVDAEGYPPSLLLKQGYLSRGSSERVTGVQVRADRITDADEGSVEVYFGSRYADGFYAWIAPLRDDTAKIGLATRHQDPRTLLNRLLRKHPVASRKLEKARLSSPVFHAIPLGGAPRRTCWPGLLTVGDAASHVKPTTGGGVITGLMGAKFAGESAAHSVVDHDPTLIQGYEKEWRRALGPNLAVMRLFRRIIDATPDRLMDRLFRSAKKVGVDDLFNRLDLDFQGSSLLALLKETNSINTLVLLLMRCIF